MFPHMEISSTLCSLVTTSMGLLFSLWMTISFSLNASILVYGPYVMLESVCDTGFSLEWDSTEEEARLTFIGIFKYFEQNQKIAKPHRCCLCQGSVWQEGVMVPGESDKLLLLLRDGGGKHLQNLRKNHLNLDTVTATGHDSVFHLDLRNTRLTVTPIN